MRHLRHTSRSPPEPIGRKLSSILSRSSKVSTTVVATYPCTDKKLLLRSRHEKANTTSEFHRERTRETVRAMLRIPPADRGGMQPMPERAHGARAPHRETNPNPLGGRRRSTAERMRAVRSVDPRDDRSVLAPPGPRAATPDPPECPADGAQRPADGAAPRAAPDKGRRLAGRSEGQIGDCTDRVGLCYRSRTARNGVLTVGGHFTGPPRFDRRGWPERCQLLIRATALGQLRWDKPDRRTVRACAGAIQVARAGGHSAPTL